MTESAFQTLWRKHIESNPPDGSCAWELKIVKNNKPFAFSQVQDHQIEGLLQARKGLFHKISDSPIFSGMRSRFTAKKSFDCLFLRANEAYVAVLFYVPRAPKVAYVIPIDVFLNLKKTWKRKSIHQHELKEISGIILIPIQAK